MSSAWNIGTGLMHFVWSRERNQVRWGHMNLPLQSWTGDRTNSVLPFLSHQLSFDVHEASGPTCPSTLDLLPLALFPGLRAPPSLPWVEGFKGQGLVGRPPLFCLLAVQDEASSFTQASVFLAESWSDSCVRLERWPRWWVSRNCAVLVMVLSQVHHCRAAEGSWEKPQKPADWLHYRCTALVSAGSSKRLGILFGLCAQLLLNIDLDIVAHKTFLL